MPLTAIEKVIDASGIAPVIEQALPAGVRERQLSARTLLAGMMAALDDGRPAHLTRVLQALTALPEADQHRPGVITDWKTGRGGGSPTSACSKPDGRRTWKPSPQLSARSPS